MRTSKKGMELMHFYEGYRTRPYLCAAQIWTVGYGHVLYQDQIGLPVVRKEGYTGLIRKEYPLRQEDNRVWSKEEIDKLFETDIRGFERGVLRLVPSVHGTQGRFDALVSLAYNIGLGNLQRSQVRIKANRGDFEGAADAFLTWAKAGGKELPGLVKRRRDERALFLSSNESTA